MADKATATVQIDPNGRITIPKSTRSALNINNQSADLTLKIEVLQRHTPTEE